MVSVSPGSHVNQNRVDQIVQFALARAAHEDDWALRELGPIHLIKYVYLADLAYARSHNGQTFTGIDWVFFHFGPWSAPLFERLDDAAQLIGARVRTFETSRADKDGKRYSVSSADADQLERQLVRELPPPVVSAIKRAVHQFSSDTTGLLHYIYQTPPMLRAAPNERLDFTLAIQQPTEPAAQSPALTRRQEKKHEAAVAASRLAFKERLTAVKARQRGPMESRPPRYDEVFEAGVRRLDAEAEVEPLRGEVVFPDDIWKGDWRDPHGGK